MKFSDRMYDTLKWICLIAIPALSVLLSTILPVLGVDGGLVITIVLVIYAVGTLAGTLIGTSTASYNAQQNLKVGGSE